MNRPGDWNCRSCNHLNFQRRESCQRCREPKPCVVDLFGQRTSTFTFNTGPDVRPGDWYCNLANCGTHNFASRSSCFKCGAAKDELSSSAAATTGFIDISDVTRRSVFGFGSSGSGGSSSGAAAARSSWKSGDWICSRLGCNEHNFASRSECFRCNAPKEH